MRTGPPVETLLVRRDLPMRFRLRLRDLSEFVQSDLAGFTCFKLFLITKGAIISVGEQLHSN